MNKFLALVCALSLPLLAAASDRTADWSSWARTSQRHAGRTLLTDGGSPSGSTTMPQPDKPGTWTCPDKLNVTFYEGKCRSGDASWAIAKPGTCVNITAVKIVADVFGPDFVIDSFSYANTAGQGAVTFFTDAACSLPSSAGFPGVFAGYDPECNIQDTTTIDGSFNVPKFLETLPGLSTNFPVKSMLFNPWWCYKDSGNPLTLG